MATDNTNRWQLPRYHTSFSSSPSGSPQSPYQGYIPSPRGAANDHANSRPSPPPLKNTSGFQPRTTAVNWQETDVSTNHTNRGPSQPPLNNTPGYQPWNVAANWQQETAASPSRGPFLSRYNPGYSSQGSQYCGAHTGDVTNSPPPSSVPYFSQWSPYSGGQRQTDGIVRLTVISPASVGIPEKKAMPEEDDDADAPPDYEECAVESEEVDNVWDESIKRGFIRKVYFTLTIQLLATVGIICAFMFWPELNSWTIQTFWVTYAAMASTLVLVLILACCVDIRRGVPMNFIFLGLFTIAEGIMFGSVCVYFEVEPVLWAMGATAFVTLALTLFAVQTKIDYTLCSGMLFALCFSLLGFGLLCAIMRSYYLQIVYASLGTALFSMYIVIDTQIMLGGNHRYALDPEEYIFAALNLYIDILTLLLLMLRLFSASSD